MQEEWKDVYFNGVYTGRKISSLGRMLFDNGVYGKPLDNGAGYLSYAVAAWRDESGVWRQKRDYVHRLVATYFHPNPHNLPQVNHKDCDKSNNCASNLEWSKRSDNINHAHAMGRMKKRTENPEIDVLEVAQVIDLYVSVKRDGVGISQKARDMDLPRTTASSIMNKRSRGVITNAIDVWLLEGVFYGRLPTIYDLGFSEVDQLSRDSSKLTKNNASGVVGVCKTTIKNKPFWLVIWKTLDGKKKSKVISVEKFGDEEAFKMACQVKEDMTLANKLGTTLKP